MEGLRSNEKISNEKISNEKRSNDKRSNDNDNINRCIDNYIKKVILNIIAGPDTDMTLDEFIMMQREGIKENILNSKDCVEAVEKLKKQEFVDLDEKWKYIEVLEQSLIGKIPIIDYHEQFMGSNDPLWNNEFVEDYKYGLAKVVAEHF